MKRLFFISFILFGMTMTSCVSKKKYEEAVLRQNELNKDLLDTQGKLSRCMSDRDSVSVQYRITNNNIQNLRDQVRSLKETNSTLMANMGDLTKMSTEGAKNLEKTLESIKEKDLQIVKMRDAITRKDSVTLALVTSLKGALGNLNDEDIEVNVEKGVVYIAISDKLLFKSGSYRVNESAKVVLGKVATVVNNKKDIEFMVEGHTDNVPISKECISDNWDLSVLRAAEVVRILQNEFSVAPERMTAAGRSSFKPLADNATTEGKAKNRRTRIVVLPKFDQFYNMVQDGMKQAIKNDK